MDDDDGDYVFMEMNLMGLDLNQEPTDQPLHRVARYGSLLNELETAHSRVEERIRHLEAVTARTRQRQRWRQSRNSMETGYSPGEMMVDVGLRSLIENNNTGTVERTAERRKGYKRDSSHLVAKALEMDSEVKGADKEGGSFYDCNICLDLARDPVLTCCGHLFCWLCFYQVSNVDSASKECPVCKGEVSDNTVIPIFGNGDSEGICVTESGLQIPPRPKARRVESVRQQRVSQGSSHVSVADALRRIMISFGAMGSQAQQQTGGGHTVSLEGRSAESAGDDHRVRIHQVSRVLFENAASLSSLSSALTSAERLVEDLEMVINSRMSRNDTQVAVLQSNDQLPLPGSTSGLNAALPINPSLESASVSGSDEHIVTRRTSSEIGLLVAPSYSLRRRRRRSIMPRNSDVDSRDTREARRRRLN